MAMHIIAFLFLLFLTGTGTSLSFAGAVALNPTNDGSSGLDTTIMQQLETLVSKACIYHGMDLSPEQLDHLVTSVNEKLQQQDPSFDADDDVLEQQRRELAFSSIHDLFHQFMTHDSGGNGLVEFFDSIGDWLNEMMQDMELLSGPDEDVPYVLPGTNSMCHDAACMKKTPKKRHHNGRKLGRHDFVEKHRDPDRVRQHRPGGTTPGKNPKLRRLY